MPKTLTEVTNAIFRNRNLWNEITDEDKEANAFIINRYFAKQWPEKAQLLNIKGLNKVSVLNMWFYFMETHSFPSCFWSKSKIKKIKNGTNKK